MPKGFEKIIDLVKKTKSQVVVLDAEGEPAYVVMDFDRYQLLAQANPDLTALSEEQLLDKVNSEIALWKEANQDKSFENWPETSQKIEEKKAVPVAKNPLNQAKIDHSAVKSAQDYFFEPVD